MIIRHTGRSSRCNTTLHSPGIPVTRHNTRSNKQSGGRKKDANHGNERPRLPFLPRQEKSLLRIASQIARSGFDNPQRIGCPASQTLKLLAQRSPSVAESPDLIDHIATCSPCFIEYSRYRTAHKRPVAIWGLARLLRALGPMLPACACANLADRPSSGVTNEVARRAEPLGPRFASWKLRIIFHILTAIGSTIVLSVVPAVRPLLHVASTMAFAGLDQSDKKYLSRSNQFSDGTFSSIMIRD
jgi:hypothetical protein